MDKEIRNVFLIFILCGVMIYLISSFSDSRNKSYHWGKVLLVTNHIVFKSAYSICRVKLDNNEIVDARCNSGHQINSKVRVIKLQTVGDSYVYSVVHVYK